VEQSTPPRVLLGNLDPIMVIGMARVLEEDGAEVIGQERHPSQIVRSAGRMRPDVVVLESGSEGSRELGMRVQRVSPETKVILCDRDEEAMEVLDPGSPTSRVLAVAPSEGLRMELTTSRHRHQVEE
jgi:AmiR/NasT family two-component response regulator